MKGLSLLTGLGIVLLWGAAAQAFYIDQGIHGMKWGDSIENDDRMLLVHQKQPAKYYIKSNTHYLAANQKVSRVSYGFYRDRLYAAFIRLRSVEQFSKLADTFSEKHGTPRVSYEDAGKQVVFRWKVNDVKIKLKMKDSIGLYKLAFYYSPLADQLNQDQLDQIPDEAYGPEYTDERVMDRVVPLVEY
jgi:hypothetical protein